MSQAEAGDALARAGITDPARRNSPHDIARGGQCFRIDTDRGTVHVVYRIAGDVLWWDATASDDARGLSPMLAALTCEVARRCGCARVRLETQRPALLRYARALGWRMAALLPYVRPAFIMEKDLA